MSYSVIVGHVVAGRFRILRFLGAGAMATVYEAEQPEGYEPRRVALKIMNPELGHNTSFVRRFEREAQAASVVVHPGSVRILAYGMSGGTSFIAMELCQGDDLSKVLEQKGPFGQARAARVMAEVADVLAVAHDLGIIHRDLKPENVILVPDARTPSGERAKVLDFGIAKMLDPQHTGLDEVPDSGSEAATQLTQVGTSLGTPAYMSPEQCSLAPIDARSDLYTCGILLYQLVTGGVPFEGETPLHTASLHRTSQPTPPSAYAPHLDPRLEAVILKCLQKDPDQRPHTARELAVTLYRLASTLPEGPAMRRAPSVRPPSSRHRAPALSPPRVIDLGPIGTGDLAGPPSSGDFGPPARVWMQEVVPTPKGLGPGALAALQAAASSAPLPATPRSVEPDPPSSDDPDERTMLRDPGPSPVVAPTLEPLARVAVTPHANPNDATLQSAGEMDGSSPDDPGAQPFTPQVRVATSHAAPAAPAGRPLRRSGPDVLATLPSAGFKKASATATPTPGVTGRGLRGLVATIPLQAVNLPIAATRAKSSAAIAFDDTSELQVDPAIQAQAGAMLPHVITPPARAAQGPGTTAPFLLSPERASQSPAEPSLGPQATEPLGNALSQGLPFKTPSSGRLSQPPASTSRGLIFGFVLGVVLVLIASTVLFFIRKH